MNIERDIIVEGKYELPISIDIFHPDVTSDPKLVLFVHGFKGFKDWGCWNLIATEFAKAGYVFIKMNFSHNGTSIDQPTEFSNLEAFGQNNYTKELSDIDQVLNWLEQQGKFETNNISLIGHSRGGGISIIKAAKDKRIKSLMLWASVSRLDYSWHDKPDYIDLWKKNKVTYLINGRTKQNMPLYFQLYKDFEKNAQRFDIKKNLDEKINIPVLIVHGTKDTAVNESNALLLKEYYDSAHLHLIEEANHVFGASHPYEASELPFHSKILVKKSLEFLKMKIT